MTTIYVVTIGEYIDYGIVSVYSEESMAEEIADIFDGRVEKYELNTPSDFVALERYKNGLRTWYVRMYRDGHSQHIDRDMESYMLDPKKPFSLERTLTLDGKRQFYVLTGVVWARDAQHAAKIANEKRVQLIAANEWPEATEAI